MGMLSFTNKHSSNPAGIGRNRGTRRSRTYSVKEQREHRARGFHRPATNTPDFVLNEFEPFFSRPEKESCIFRPRRIQGGNHPFSYGRTRAQAGRTGRRTARLPQRSALHKLRACAAGTAQAFGHAASWTRLIRCPPTPPSSSSCSSCLPPPPHFPGRSPGAAPRREPPVQPRLPRGRRPLPPGAPSAGRGGSGCEAQSLAASLNP